MIRAVKGRKESAVAAAEATSARGQVRASRLYACCFTGGRGRELHPHVHAVGLAEEPLEEGRSQWWYVATVGGLGEAGPTEVEYAAAPPGLARCDAGGKRRGRGCRRHLPGPLVDWGGKVVIFGGGEVQLPEPACGVAVFRNFG